MNNFLKRTLSGFFFVVLVISSILVSKYTFVAFFALITALSLYEFHKLSNKQKDVNVNSLAAIIGGVLLFGCSFISAYNISRYPVFSIYGLYVVTVFIWELYRKRANPLNSLAYFILGQIYVALPFSLLNFILFINSWQPWVLLSVFITIWVNGQRSLFIRSNFRKAPFI